MVIAIQQENGLYGYNKGMVTYGDISVVGGTS